jgi:hypothetical protein
MLEVRIQIWNTASITLSIHIIGVLLDAGVLFTLVSLNKTKSCLCVCACGVKLISRHFRIFGTMSVSYTVQAF